MNRFRKRRWWKTLSSVLCLILLAGLGSSPHVSGGEGNAEDGELSVALTGKYPPFSFYDSDGNLTGFDVDVSKELARQLGMKSKIITTEWDGILPGLLANKYDAIVGSMAITEERKKAVNFTDPYYVSGAQLFIHMDFVGKINSIADCKGRAIGVSRGETYEHYLVKNHPEIEVKTYKGANFIFEDVRNGRLAGFVTDKLVGSWQIKKADEPFVPVGNLLYRERIGIPVIKSRPDLLNKLNIALGNMRKSGKFDKIHDKYFGLTTSANMSGDTELSVALTGKYPPFSFYDANGDLTGFDVDVSKELARQLGMKSKIVTTEWDGILPGLLANKYDAIVGSMAITEERKKTVDFTDPYYVSGAQLFVHKDYVGKINSIDDCNGKALGVSRGETYEHYLVKNHPEINVKTYKGANFIFQDVRNGRLVGFVTDRLVGSWQIKKAGEPFVPVGDLLYRERIGIPVIKSRPELLNKLNIALGNMRKSGKFDEIHDKYFGLADTGNKLSDTELSVALTGKYPPFSYYNKDGKLTGFDVDVAKELARQLGMKSKIVTTEWDGILPGLLAKKYDAIVGSMAITEERKKAVNFTGPYYISGAQLFVHKDYVDKINSINDCAGKPIGVNRGETYEHFLVENHPEIEVKTYKGANLIFEDVRNGRLVGFVTDKLVGSWQIKKAGEPFVPVGELLYKERIGIPVIKSRTPLLNQLNNALGRMRRSGKFDQIHDRYFGLGGSKKESASDGALKMKTIVRKLAKGFAKTLGVAFASLLIGFILAIPGGAILNRRQGLAYHVTRAVIDFIRGTPVLIQLFFVYYGAGSPQIGIVLSPISAAILTLSVNAGAYMAEVVRSGLMSVDPGQTQAARALGLNKWQSFRYVVWPQAFRIAIPPLMNSVVALTKDTALISVIAVSEVISEAQSIISITFDPLTYYFIVAVMFFAVTFPLMKIAGRLEERIRRQGYSND